MDIVIVLRQNVAFKDEVEESYPDAIYTVTAGELIVKSKAGTNNMFQPEIARYATGHWIRVKVVHES